MVSKTLVVQSCESLKKLVNTSEINKLAKNTSSILIQIFTSEVDSQWVRSIETILQDKFQEAVIVGASTGGEIAHGQLYINSTIVSLTFFESTTLKAFIMDIPNNNEVELGKELCYKIENICNKIAGVLLLTTPITMNTSEFLIGFSSSECTYPVFGGGAGDYGYILKSLIFYRGQYLSKGVVAVVLLGDKLKIDIHTCLGWEPLSNGCRLF